MSDEVIVVRVSYFGQRVFHHFVVNEQLIAHEVNVEKQADDG